MTVTAPVSRPPVAVRRTGYLIAAAINATMLYLINASPGWQALPFLTADTAQVLLIVNLTIAANLAVDVVYLAYDAPWWKAVGDLITAAVGLASAIRLLQVFPFDFTGYAFNWALAVRVILIVGVIGISIAIVVQIVAVIRALYGSGGVRG